MARREPAARCRSRGSARRSSSGWGSSRGGYVVATLHREANVVEPRLGRIARGPAAGSTSAVVFPAHPRTRAAIDRRRTGLGPCPARRAARLPRLRRARLAGARDRHRLRAACRRRRTGTASRASPPGRRPSGWTRSRRARTCSSTTTPTGSPRRSRTATMPADAAAALRRRARRRADRGGSVPFPAE